MLYSKETELNMCFTDSNEKTLLTIACLTSENIQNQAKIISNTV